MRSWPNSATDGYPQVAKSHRKRLLLGAKRTSDVRFLSPNVCRATSGSRGVPVPRALHHAAALGIGDKLYVIGGYVDGWNPTDSVYEYDPKLDLWRLLAPLPTARGALAALALDGKIHAIGGTGSGRRNTPAHEVL